MQLASSTRSASSVARNAGGRSTTVRVRAGLFDFLNKDKELSIKVTKAAPKKAAKATPAPSFSFSLPSFGRDEDEEEVAPKKAAAPKAKKPASALASITRPKQGYVYEGKGKSGDREFSTVESMRQGKMRPDNIDLNTPRSFW